MSTLPGASAILFLNIFLEAQQLPYPTSLNPKLLYVGGVATNITAYNQSYSAGLTAFWNGSARPALWNSNNVYIVALTAADLAVPQLGQLTMVDPTSGAVIDTVNYPVAYNVAPLGIALDQTRGRLYVATPSQTSDPNFPPNSLVALDITSGAAGPAIEIGSALGDIALSDDGSALYVVVEGQNVVRTFDPATFAALVDFPFRTAGSAPGYADRVAVMPGKPGTVAVSGTQVAIYDSGVKRPNGIAIGCCGYASLLFSPDGKYLFQDGAMSVSSSPNAADNHSVILRYAVDSTGIPVQTPPFAVGAGASAIAGGTLFTSLGTAIDYQSMKATGSFGIGGAIAVDPAAARAFIVYSPPATNSSGFGPPIEIAAFGLPGIEPLGTVAIGVAANPNLKSSAQLLRFGVDGFVIPATDGLLLFHTPLAGPSPGIAPNAVVNAASQQPGPIAPGEILTLYGTNLGPPVPQPATNSNGAYPLELSNVQVFFGRTPGTPLVAYQGQINVVAPFEQEPGTNTDLQVWYYGNPSAKLSLPVASAAPALFTQNGSGSGPVAVVNQDGSINAPAPAGGIVTLYGTGGGGSGTDGAIARRPGSLAASVHVSIAGRDAPVLYAGAAPGLVNGAFQLNVMVPTDAPSGQAAIVVNVSGQDSPQGATLAIR
jgi:uncharacterized protein (TIGR03437 family)